MLLAEPLLEEVPLSGREESGAFLCQADVSNNSPVLGLTSSTLALNTGQELDLVSTNTSEYTPKDQQTKRGKLPVLGILMAVAGALTMQFKLVAAGTNELVSQGGPACDWADKHATGNASEQDADEALG